METVQLSVTVDLETASDTEAVELQWLLNLLREELTKSRAFRGKIRRVQFVSNGVQPQRGV
jgi:hypothetical protein